MRSTVSPKFRRMIAAPLLDGAENDTRNDPGAVRTTVTFVGAAGEPTLIGADVGEAGLVPRA